MQAGSLPRPVPLPISPHLRQSHVLKMINDEGQEINRQAWPPRNTGGARRPNDYLTQIAKDSAKKVAWPPHLDHEGINEEYLSQQDPSYQREHQQPNYQGINQNQNDGQNLTTTYPSGFKLKDELTMSQPGAQVVTSQPAFKITQPLKMRGDTKWPPRKGGEEDMTQEEVREFVKPKKQTRDYSEFFAQNALPNNYPGYRAPPGTQHHGGEEEQEE